MKTALSLSEESLAIAEKLSGAESPLAAKFWATWDRLTSNKDSIPQALSCYSRSLAITEKIYGREHPKVALLLNNIADLYQDMGDFAKAEDYYQRSLSAGRETERVGASESNALQIEAIGSFALGSRL